ncbi:hypothetical protein PV10_02965 [Exophiala mesophila]|uniref:Uncharacterized protein n=1 Tax=Exophiala mesophila TaxID=212818 RepID=A0A0D2A8H9_EXOME|nr:uncharacterized protein PV10_02965 [Exophiala mesophila]KIV95293.1 hypothetical protein PV10_02965 [Exophiala mesophila]
MYPPSTHPTANYTGASSMGNKRKAYVLEEPDSFSYTFNHYPSSSPITATNTTNSLPSLSSSPFSSTSTATIITPPPPITTTTRSYPQHAQSWTWNASAIPYLNSRTRKRHRDNRPDENEIHDNTMRKLYDAQRLHLDEAMPMSEVLAMDLDQDQHEGDEDEDAMDFDHSLDFTSNWGASHHIGGPTPPAQHMKQSTLDGFFGRKQQNPPAATAQAQAQALSPSYSCDQAQRQMSLSGPMYWPTADKGGCSPSPRGFSSFGLHDNIVTM